MTDDLGIPRSSNLYGTSGQNTGRAGACPFSFIRSGGTGVKAGICIVLALIDYTGTAFSAPPGAAFSGSSLVDIVADNRRHGTTKIQFFGYNYGNSDINS